MWRHVIYLGLALALGLSAHADAQSTGSPSDHESLRGLKEAITKAVNQRDFAAVGKLLRQPFMVTLTTQDSFTDLDKLKAYYEDLFTRDTLRMKNISIAADADDYSKIFEGTFALTKGSTREHYELADGRSFDMNGRWTAVSLKDNGEWKLLAVHTGTNFLDNAVLAAVESSVLRFAAGGAAVGLIVGFGAGWFVKRAQGKRIATG